MAELLIDRFMPSYPFGERHQRWVRASPGRTLQAVREVTPAEVRFLLPLTAIRSLRPGRLFGQERAPARHRAPIGGALAGGGSVMGVGLAGGFVVLGEQPDRELLLGTVGRFWSLRRNEPVGVADAEAFLAFDRPGYAKGTINFYVQAEGGGCRVTTE